uniref:eIF-2-alpha kinase activator GCN1-like n=1 Tax=Styela clava TaxID=7725 RepID=UPI00193A7410|nr:eIF-2-alpha kinase activator GCN1-like [Styela clava]
MGLSKEEMQQVVKNLMFGNDVVKKSEYLEKIDSIITVMEDPGCPAPVIYIVVHALASGLNYYQCTVVQRKVLDVLRTMLKLFPTAANTAITQSLDKIAQYQLNNTTPSRSESARALLALSWSCLLAEVSFVGKETGEFILSSKNDAWCQLVNVQASLHYGACAAGYQPIKQSAFRKLKKVWKMIGKKAPDVYIDCLKKGSPSIPCCGLLGAIASYDPSAIQKRKTDFLDLFVKLIIMSKTKPLKSVLDSCGPALKFVTHDDFNSFLFPAIQKATLRSPENVLQTVSSVLSQMSIDLSQHAMDISKCLTAQLISKNDKIREETVEVVHAMAKQISDAGIMQDVVKLFFGVLKGKLAIAGQKVDVLESIGKLSCCPVSKGESTNVLLATVSDNFQTFMLQENYEGALVKALSCMSAWCGKLSTDIPKSLIEMFKKGPTLKASTAAVRCAYIECMICSFTRDTLSQANEFSASLLATVEKASGQAMQIPIVSEALSASHLIAKISAIEHKIVESKLSSFWNVVLDSQKSIFTSDKFLQQASDTSLIRLILFSETLFLEQMARLDDDVTRIYASAIVKLLLHKDWKIRSCAQRTVKKLLSSLSGDNLCMVMLAGFSSILRPTKVIDLESLDDTAEILKTYIHPKRFEMALKSILNIPGIDSDKGKATLIALEILLDCHHPCIQSVNEDMLTDFLYQANLDAAEFIANNIDIIMKEYATTTTHSQSSLKVLSDLTRIAPHTIMPELLKYATPILQDPTLLQITRNEYGIMNTPEGELWNKSIIDSGPKVAENKNIRRENKAYSYKEQMEFRQLEKEMEAKKLAKGGGGGVKGSGGSKGGVLQSLSKKQREMMEAELQRESGIRKKLMQLNKVVKATFLSLDACIQQQNALELSHYIPQIIELAIPLLQSLLASTLAQNLFLTAEKIVSCEALNQLGIQIAYATIRLYDPIQAVEQEWSEEDLVLCTKRLTHMLHLVTKTPLTTPCFCYIFPFLTMVLKDAGAKIEGDEKMMTDALQIIIKHAKVSSTQDDGPEFLPRQRMLDSMQKLIGTTTVTIQNLACDAFISTCEAIASMGKESSELVPEIESLLQCLLSPVVTLRRTSLQGLSSLLGVLPTGAVRNDLVSKLSQRIWVARHDTDEECKALADSLWTKLLYSTNASLCLSLIDDITYHEPNIQQSAAEALFSALEENTESCGAVLQSLINLYTEKSHRPPPVLDDLGRVISESSPDDYQSRVGIAKALCSISPVLSDDQMQPLFSFFVPDALKDRHEEVRANMLEAALKSVNEHGKSCTNTLMQVFEDFLKQAPNSESFDIVRQSVVILMGTLARHLDKDNPRVKPIVAKLTEALSTPSQPVQEAVAKCLPPLVPAIKSDAPDIVKKMLVILLESENYGERKGAAYGLAGMIKGLGIIAFKQLDIMSTLTEAIQDKKNYRHREGALFAFEMFCTMLGRLFEPYVVHVLPYLLLCFGDGNQYVREAADDTARAVMKNLSAHGVKLVLPSLLSALEEDSWRTKTGSVELLGAMAYCAPKQLSSCLPSVVPRLCDIITDSHPKVQKAGQQALKQIGSVIRNPEILSIAPVLLGALSDPFRKTSKCLQTLLDTKFVHFIDAPSLALIMPVVHRAFEDRSTDTRKMAAQIIGNMYSLTDQKDLNPYLAAVVPGLKNTLLDPVPEVRTVAAKALGAMVKGTGESLFEDLLPWLMETLTSEQSSVDRSGSAQGLSEVLGALGVSKLEKLMPDIIRMAGSADVLPHVRDGYIMLYIYLPSTFGDDFTPFIDAIIPALLQSLADECEFLRDTALLAGQRIIGMYAQQAVALLLPQLESGLLDDNWRIRLSSIQLLGELLYQVSGVTGKMSTHGEEDDNFGTMEGQKAIREVLGDERCQRVFSGLYIGRSDVMLQVRQSALHVWKIVVPNTPRVLREILPVLFELLLGCLASSSYDKRQVAARTLGDIVRKLGERMLPEIIPILESELESEDEDQRQGVCIGLSEIIKSCSKDAILTFSDSLLPTVRKGLCDSHPDVRTAAATTFENLHAAIGQQALEEILPDLLEKIGDPEISEYIVDGLRQVIAVKGKVVLPFIVPKLIEPPINTRVLSFLSAVAGESLTRHLAKILKALLSALVAVSDNEETYATTLSDCEGVILSVEGEHGTRIIMDDLLEATKSDDKKIRRAAVTMLHAFCKDTDSDYSSYVAIFIRVFFKLMADEDQSVQEEAWSALSAVVKCLDAAEQLQHVSSVRQAIRYISDEIRANGGILPGFCLPKKGMTSVLPILREGILNGAPDMKEQSAKALTECIQILTPIALKPSVVTITGPLIRILGDRFNANVRVAVLETLTLLLEKAGAFLKPFLPQLQTTFGKALHDANRPVRLQSSKALKHLVLIHTRLDPLFTDLNNNVKTEDDPLIKETMLQALRGCIQGAGAKINPKIQNEISSTLTSLLGSEEEMISKCSAGCLGTLCASLPDNLLDDLLKNQVLVKSHDASWPLRQGRSALLAVALKESPEKIFTEDREDATLSTMLDCASLDRVQIVTNGVHAAAYALVYCVQSSRKVPSQINETFKKAFQHNSNDVKVVACTSAAWAVNQINTSGRTDATTNGHGGSIVPIQNLIFFVSQLIVITKEKNTTVRSSAEYAIITVLSLRQSEEILKEVSASLPSRDVSSLAELQKTKFKKLIAAKEIIEDIDDTLITK